MTDSERAEQLRFLSQTHRTSHEQRRQLEVRVLIITLSTFGLFAFGALKGEITLKFTLVLDIAIWHLFFLLALFSTLYLRKIHAANSINIRLAEAAEDELAEIARAAKYNQILKERVQYDRNQFWSWEWQAVIIFIVACASAFLVTV